jgi:hypothetical protein
LQVVAVSTIVLARDLGTVYAGFALYGLAQGGGGVLTEIMIANYYGRLTLGSIRGAMFPVMTIFGAAGPPVIGFSFDYTGSYTFGFSIIIGASILAAALILFATKPQKRVPADLARTV